MLDSRSRSRLRDTGGRGGRPDGTAPLPTAADAADTLAGGALVPGGLHCASSEPDRSRIAAFVGVAGSHDSDRALEPPLLALLLPLPTLL